LHGTLGVQRAQDLLDLIGLEPCRDSVPPRRGSSARRGLRARGKGLFDGIGIT